MFLNQWHQRERDDFLNHIITSDNIWVHHFNVWVRTTYKFISTKDSQDQGIIKQDAGTLFMLISWNKATWCQLILKSPKNALKPGITMIREDILFQNVFGFPMTTPAHMWQTRLNSLTQLGWNFLLQTSYNHDLSRVTSMCFICTWYARNSSWMMR